MSEYSYLLVCPIKYVVLFFKIKNRLLKSNFEDLPNNLRKNMWRNKNI